MKKFNPLKEEVPASINLTYDIGYWARRWKVSVIQIGDAIRNTGSNQVRVLKEYLERRSLI